MNNPLGLVLPDLKLISGPDVHVYRMDGEIVPSVSEVIDVGAKPWLAPWKLREMRKRLMKTWKPGQPYAREEIDQQLEEAAAAADEKSKGALVIGKAAHTWIEAYVRIRPMLGSLQFPMDELDPEARSSVEAFLGWEAAHHVRWLASEQILGSRKYQYAGTTDFVAFVDDLLTLGDFKTSDRFSMEYALQLSGYQLAIEECDPGRQYPIRQRLIVRLPKDDAPFQAWTVQTDPEEDAREFLRRRESLRWREEHVRKRAGWLLW